MVQYQYRYREIEAHVVEEEHEASRRRFDLLSGAACESQVLNLLEIDRPSLAIPCVQCARMQRGLTDSSRDTLSQPHPLASMDGNACLQSRRCLHAASVERHPRSPITLRVGNRHVHGWQPERNRCSDPKFTFQLDLSAMQTDDLFDDAHPESCAGNAARGVGAIEPLADSR